MPASANTTTEAQMHAIRCETYGSPSAMRTESVAIPEPAPDQVLVRVRAASVNPADWHLLRGDPYIARLVIGLRRPRSPVLGSDLSGEVHALGADVSGFAIGQEVVGSTFMEGFGAFAEYALVRHDLLTTKPRSVSHEQAAAIPLAGSTALQGLRDHGQLRAGQRVLVIGGSGGVGTFAVQLAADAGAEVTAVCSTAKVEMVRSLGADHVVDYTEQTLDDLVAAGERYELVLQAAGPNSVSTVRAITERSGTAVLISGDAKGRWLGAARKALAATILNPFVSQRLASFTVDPTQADIATLLKMTEMGAVTPIIDRVYPLEQVPEALSYLEEGHAAGKVIITS